MKLKKILVRFFCIILGIGFLAQVLRVDFFIVQEEKRKMAPFPESPLNIQDMRRFLGEYDSWFSDHFGLRNVLILAGNLFKTRILKSSSSPSVLLGRDGWLFLGGQNYDDYRNMKPFTVDQIKNWVQTFEERKDKLNKQGVAYVLFVPPNPHTVYPEYLPEWLSGNKAYPFSRLDQLKAALSQKGKVKIVDIRKEMQQEKLRHPQNLLYHKTDTHWNARGSFIGYQALMEEVLSEYKMLGKKPPVFARRVPVFSVKKGLGGDLAGMLGLASWMEEEYFFETEVSSRSQGRGRAVVFCDSFFMKEFFSRHFQSVVYGPGFDFHLIDENIPDLVVEEHVERHLMSLGDSNASR